MLSFGGPQREFRLPLLRSQSASRDDGKRSDGATLIPWARAKAVAWDVAVVDTFAQSYIGNISSLAGAAVNHAVTLKTSTFLMYRCQIYSVHNIIK